jgi:hypothetical protein
MNLRSGCDLCRPEEPVWELLDMPARDSQPFVLAQDGPKQLLNDAIAAAGELIGKDSKKPAVEWNLKWREEPIKLKPSDDLVQLILNSQELAKKEGEET